MFGIVVKLIISAFKCFLPSNLELKARKKKEKSAGERPALFCSTANGSSTAADRQPRSTLAFEARMVSVPDLLSQALLS